MLRILISEIENSTNRVAKGRKSNNENLAGKGERKRDLQDGRWGRDKEMKDKEMPEEWVGKAISTQSLECRINCMTLSIIGGYDTIIK